MAEPRTILAALNGNRELSALMAAPPPGCPRGAALAAAGVPYRLNGRGVPPPAADHVLALSMVRSPLLTGAGDIDAMDAWRALYAIVNGTAGLRPLAGLDGCLREMARAARDCGTDPAAAVADRSAAAWAEIDAAALAMAHDYGCARPQEVADLILAMLADVADAWGAGPPAPEKKTTAGRMATGLAGLWSWARGPACRPAKSCTERRSRWWGWRSAPRSTSKPSIRPNASTASERTESASLPVR